METARLKKWRMEFLIAIDQYRKEGRNIVYLDETWFDTYDTPKKGWVDLLEKCQNNAPLNKDRRITIIPDGTKNGFIPNVLC